MLDSRALLVGQQLQALALQGIPQAHAAVAAAAHHLQGVRQRLSAQGRGCWGLGTSGARGREGGQQAGCMEARVPALQPLRYHGT